MSDYYSDLLEYASEIKILAVGFITRMKIPPSIIASQTCIRIYTRYLEGPNSQIQKGQWFLGEEVRV